jgi:hypothetical protein
MTARIAGVWLTVCGVIGEATGVWLPVPGWVERAYEKGLKR